MAQQDIIDELNYLKETKQQIKQAIIGKGQTIATDTPFREYVTKINNINVEPDKPDQTKSCTPTTSQQVIEPDTGYELTSVIVNAVTSSIDNNIQPENIKSGVEILGVTGTYSSGGTDTSDANATSGDILENKTAYVNGQKLTGTLGTNVTSTFNDTNAELYTKIQNIYDSMTPLVASDSDKRAGLGTDIITIPSKSDGTPLLDTSNVTDMSEMFLGCSSLITIPLLDTSNVEDMIHMFDGCSSLTTIPLLNTSKVTAIGGIFNGCSSLSNTSLNNILAMCINAVSYTYTKTLKSIGLTQTQAQTCTTLSNYQNFVNAGWTTGY